MFKSDQDLVSYIEYNQLQRVSKIHPESKEKLQQYFTPASVARLMASIFEFDTDNVKILDPGAGAGILFTATVNEILRRNIHPKSITVLAFETDSSLKGDIQFALGVCEKACESAGVKFSGQVRLEDFIESTVKKNGLYNDVDNHFTHIIVNPPYKKLNTGSYTYKLLKSIGRHSPNLYTAFLSMAETYLTEKGQLISITPRSFCNGVYFKHFRERFLSTVHISVIHLFTSRTKAFSIDKVLQENIIIKWVKSFRPTGPVKVLSSEGPEDIVASQREVEENDVVDPNDKEHIIKIVQDYNEETIRKLIDGLPYKLKDLALKASTGPIVYFRVSDLICREKTVNSVPLIQPECVSSSGYVHWNPFTMKKSPYIELSEETKNILVQDYVYVLVKRFTSNEERKRIVASVYIPMDTYKGLIGIENRVNYIHANRKGIDLELAKGLTLYLNSTMVDSYFRQISGHTQVNASDLERLKYPDMKTLKSLGNEFGDKMPVQAVIDDIVKREVFLMSEKGNDNDPIDVKKKIGEALEILRAIGMPREQQNERSALTLLSLLDLKPTDPWSKASNPLMGITPMMKFFEDNYGKKYAPNSRETVRRFTVHQFCQAHIVIENPDDHTRPTNSPKAVYQISPLALKLIRSFGTAAWGRNLRRYLIKVPPIDDEYKGIRNGKRIVVPISTQLQIDLSPGGQNNLVEKIIKLFVTRFLKKPKILYVGDAEKKFLHYDKEGFKAINIELNPHGKIPDVIILDLDRNWLYLIEAVTSHGPINRKRRNELENVFSGSTAGLIYVTAFPDRGTMVRYLKEISWESEVWIAETPDHLIHFNGDRFLGPYESPND
ncbi:MAG: BsuBI/PstI family type II restriction endonuclease [Thermoplasmatales archaeon]